MCHALMLLPATNSSEDLLSSGHYIIHLVLAVHPDYMSPCEREEGKLTISTDVIRLDVDTLDLAALDHKSVTLATVGTEECSGRELNVQGTREGTTSISEEADAAGLVGIEGLAPGGGSGWGHMLVFCVFCMMEGRGAFHTRRDH